MSKNDITISSGSSRGKGSGFIVVAALIAILVAGSFWYTSQMVLGQQTGQYLELPVIEEDSEPTTLAAPLNADAGETRAKSAP